MKKRRGWELKVIFFVYFNFIFKELDRRKKSQEKQKKKLAGYKKGMIFLKEGLRIFYL